MPFNDSYLLAGQDATQSPLSEACEQVDESQFAAPAPEHLVQSGSHCRQTYSTHIINL